MLSSGVNRSDSATAFGAGLIYCSSWGSGNGKFLMFWSIYKVTLTGRSEVINTSFLVRCFHLWGSSREAPAGWRPPVLRHPGALQHPPLGSEQPDRPTEAAAHTPLRTTHMVVNVSQYTPNKKNPWICMKSFSTLGLAPACSSPLLFCLHKRHKCSIRCVSATDRSIDFDPKAIAKPCKHSSHGSHHHDGFSALHPYLL